MLLGIALILPFCAIAMVVGPSDAELVERFKGGDRSAFNEIVQRYQHRVFTMCMRKMGNEQVASEVAQDVFVALFRALGRFRGDSQLSTWIYRVVINHCKNHVNIGADAQWTAMNPWTVSQKTTTTNQSASCPLTTRHPMPPPFDPKHRLFWKSPWPNLRKNNERSSF